MRGIIISSNGSGGGKTTFTMGLLKAMVSRGENVESYKVGPDYIDPAFHSFITNKPCRNLDLYIMGEHGVEDTIANGNGDFAVIEGVMGLYDGKGITEEYSTYHLSEKLGLPIILVLSPKGVSNTICAEIMGLRDYRGANIAGIVLNGISKMYYELLKKIIEENCKIPVLGCVPRDERLVLGSRNLGLVQSSEIEDLENKIKLAGELVEENVDIDRVMELCGDVHKWESAERERIHEGLRIGVARDRAFSFYYEDNLDMMKEYGELVYFSPIDDKNIPENLDFLYLGGGYPEVFKRELSQNKSMRESIRKALEDGLPSFAECGGLMYLTEGMGDEEGDYPFVSFFRGKSEMRKRLQNFGYAQLSVSEESPLHTKEISLRCHEFHRSVVAAKEKRVYSLSKTDAYGRFKEWKCGYIKKNTLAGYPHVHFKGNREFLHEMMMRALQIKKEKVVK